MKRLFLPALLVLSAASPALAETLSNDTVLAMIAAGLPDEVVVAKIKASEAQFNLTTEDIIALKGKGLSGAVIAAMLDRAVQQKQSAMSPDSPDPREPHPAGVYVLQDWLPAPKMARIDATVTNQAKTGGLLGYAFTGGIASMSMKASIQNPTARTQVQSRKPVFYMFFDESNPGQNGGSGAWLAGTAATIVSPNELTLVQLMKKDGRREARVGSINIAGAKTGVMDKDRLAFDYELVRPGVFKIVPKAELAPGEFGFLYSLTGGGGAGALTARIFDFTIN